MPERPPLTDGNEIGAYVVTHVIKVAAAYAAARFYTASLFGWAYTMGGMMAVTAVSLAMSVVWAVLGLALFLALRPNFGPLPAVVRRAGGGVTTGFEIGAYALAQAIGIVAGYLAFSAVLPVLQPLFPAAGRAAIAMAASLAVGAVVAAFEFLLFVYARRHFGRRPEDGVFP